MSEQINFTGVDSASDDQWASPGTIGIFEIADVKYVPEEGESKPKLQVSFKGADGEGLYRENYFLTQKALPRLKTAIETITGGAVDGAFDVAKIKGALVGKKIGLKIGGRIGTDGNGYADVGYGGYMCPATPEEVAKMKFSTKEKAQIDAAINATANAPASENEADELSGGANGQPAPTTLDEEV